MDVVARSSRANSGHGARASTDMCPSLRLKAGVMMSLAVLMIPRGTGDVATAVLSAPFKGTNVDSVGGGRDNEGTDGGADGDADGGAGGGAGGGIDGVVQLSIEVNDAETHTRAAMGREIMV